MAYFFNILVEPSVKHPDDLGLGAPLSRNQNSESMLLYLCRSARLLRHPLLNHYLHGVGIGRWPVAYMLPGYMVDFRLTTTSIAVIVAQAGGFLIP